MASIANTKNIYLLNGPNDWDSFEQSYIMKISAERVYELGRLDDLSQFNTRRIQTPTRPEITNYLARAGPETRSGTTRLERGERTATTVSELHPEDRKSYQIEMALYQQDQRDYNKQADGIGNVLNWMIEKINPHYVETCSPAANGSDEYDNISRFYSNLKAACGIDDALRRKQARKRYFEVLKVASSGTTHWGEWITSWEQAMRIAKLRGVAEAMHPNTWFDDLREALDDHFEVFMRVEEGQNKGKIENGTYQPLNFSAQFRQELQTSQKPDETEEAPPITEESLRSMKRSSSHEDEDRSPSPDGRATERPAKIRRRSQGLQEECILCERIHRHPNTKSCWVAFPEGAPDKYQPSERQIDQWERRLEENEEVRELYKRLQQR
ncbi:uncharacterized protein NECHADRAFT_102289 [Fusarium vanettenii 77-13-4]|uniref:Uncharacterized protein n=1 Tax=Fusarium vanettenii (strain ATCC MYA-4622 / CBS 123669 / FGSC 9596 / NRRL 45880 / 77-13-4) TaxID=660122 RepID=C7ZQG8_FUSV7|nr:uncharacterized protein NECHADRAFT_102289 [Fusarium vanettenii 77-13-4]EEU33745.1 hypothetical protein NECHADRAFT_102289 [Fusarium vanettenii 77-13-4]